MVPDVGASPVVVLASEQPLVGEAVRAALTERGHAVSTLRWEDEPPRPRSTGEPPRPADVGLMISEFDRWEQLARVGATMTSVSLPWVVLTSAGRGPTWGAVVRWGARSILASDAPLEIVDRALGIVARGGATLRGEDMSNLVASWERYRRRRERLRQRWSMLSPREREVLMLLYAGDTVDRIAASLGLSRETVRSQVKMVLRKMEVNSQLAAVAAYRQLVDLHEDLP